MDLNFVPHKGMGDLTFGLVMQQVKAIMGEPTRTAVYSGELYHSSDTTVWIYGGWVEDKNRLLNLVFKEFLPEGWKLNKIESFDSDAKLLGHQLISLECKKAERILESEGLQLVHAGPFSDGDGPLIFTQGVTLWLDGDYVRSIQCDTGM